MIGWKPGDDVGALEPWPFDAAESQYRIVAGAPRAFGRLDAGGPGHPTRLGIWRCTAGAFECTEQGDELMTVLSGRGRVTELAGGRVHELAAGDSLFLRHGSRVRWEIDAALTKVFFAAKPGGY